MEASPFWGWPSIILPPHLTMQRFFTWRTMASSHEGKISTAVPCQRIQLLMSWVYLSLEINGSFAEFSTFSLGDTANQVPELTLLAPSLKLDPINSAKFSTNILGICIFILTLQFTTKILLPISDTTAPKGRRKIR